MPLTIGRDASVCSFALDSTSYPKILSKVHCVLVCQRGRLFLMDNGSTNGTLVNGTKVDKRKPMPIPSGSLVLFGGKKSDLMYELIF
jgi:pSer/pThr/pTyr-binding forkhead associated (FHA) protein